MKSIAHTRPFVIGVDTHAANHVYSILTSTGEVRDTQEFPTTSKGIQRAINWVGRRTGGDMDALWVIEGCSSYGAILTGTLVAMTYTVCEAPFIDPKNRHGKGKDDNLDSIRIALSVLPLKETELRVPRLDQGIRPALQVLTTAREEISKDRTRCINALTALVRRNTLGVDARQSLTERQIKEISTWRRRQESLALQITRTEAIRLAKRVTTLAKELSSNHDQISALVSISEAAPLLTQTGYGPISLAVCLAVWSHPGRIRSEAAFAALAGVNPIPASSGNTTRHRLNRSGDRRLNSAIHTIATTRMTWDKETQEYTQRRLAQGKTKREIKRILKRYIARNIYRTLNATATQNPA